MPSDNVDVVVIGARVGGSVLAARLASEGFRVLLVDSARFPSETPSTHFFRGSGLLAALKRVGALEVVLQLGAPHLVREYSYSRGQETPEIGPPQAPGELGFNLSVRRVTLDAALAQYAASLPGVEFAERTRAIGLQTDAGRVTGVHLEGPLGPRSVKARSVVGADGRHSWLAREVGAPYRSSEAGHRGMYYAYYAGFEGPSGSRDGPEFSSLGDELAYVFPSDGGLACVALSLNLESFRWCQADPGTRFVERMARHRGIASRLAKAVREGGMRGAGPAPNFVRTPFGQGWALVGDSEMHQDPWSGRGLDSAGTHAVLLGNVLARWFRGEISEGEAGRSYTTDRDKLSMEIYESTVRASRNLAEP
jgi:flavin-dependent dehydrogenase